MTEKVFDVLTPSASRNSVARISRTAPFSVSRPSAVRVGAVGPRCQDQDRHHRREAVQTGTRARHQGRDCSDQTGDRDSRAPAVFRVAGKGVNLPVFDPGRVIEIIHPGWQPPGHCASAGYAAENRRIDTAVEALIQPQMNRRGAALGHVAASFPQHIMHACVAGKWV